jgi:hypothetical protein
MYSRQEAAQLKKEFWTAFGQYMTPVPSADGEKLAWANYKTGEKDIYFRLQATNKTASVAIELTHGDAEVQQLYFEQFLQLKRLLEQTTGEEWFWRKHTTDEWGKTVSLIYTELPGVSVFNREDWPGLISFFKPRIIALDKFWNNVKYSFEALH